MSDSAWELKGVDPETRQQAVEEAQRLGVSLADYLTNKVLQAAILDQAVAVPAAEEPPPAELGEFGMRARFRALERREFLDQLLQPRAEPVVLDREHPEIGLRFINIVDRFEAFEVRHGIKMPAYDPAARSFSERSSGETLKRPMR